MYVSKGFCDTKVSELKCLCLIKIKMIDMTEKGM